MKKHPTIKQVLKWYEQMRFPLFQNNKKDFNVNLWVYRAYDDETDIPNDFAGILWKDPSGTWQQKTYVVTADAGLDGLISPKVEGGTAIIKHDEYYKGVYFIGVHASANSRYRHTALRQQKPMKYWRDNNKDKKRDYEGKVYEGIYYTNFHSVPEHWDYNEKIRFNSIGCIWMPDNKLFHKEFMPIMHQAAANWGNSFSLAMFYEGTVG
jgi:hypothetical protein